MFKKMAGLKLLLTAIAMVSTLAMATDKAAAGRILFSDGSDCYHVSPYFKENNHPKLSLLRNNVVVQGPITLGRFNEYGQAPGRDGLTTPFDPGIYKLKLDCGDITYIKQVANQFQIPNADMVFSINTTPKINKLAIWAPKAVIFKSTVPVLMEKVRQVPPGSSVQVRFTVKDQGDTLSNPSIAVKSIYGKLSLKSKTQSAANTWNVVYTWKIPNSPGIYDVYVSVDDKRGGRIEASAKVNAKTGKSLPALTVTSVAEPSDAAKQNDHFLTYFSTKASTYEQIGADTSRGSCQYYLDLGFASKCNGDSMTTAITFAQWKKGWGFGKSANASKEVNAVYVNLADLGLERNMNAIYSSKGVAFYVCNHPYDDKSLSTTVDTKLTRAITGDALVACVAMEYSKTTGLNGGNKFTKFLVFDPTGRLTRRVNLDGRGIKQVPGACVVCHGASNYSTYPETSGTGSAVLGANFLPFDLENFAFSKKSPYRKSDQQDEFRKLNEYVRDKTGPAAAITDLINGWYPTGNSNFTGSYVPTGWSGNHSLYNKIVKPACRTCHVAMGVSFDSEAMFESYASIGYISTFVCGNNSAGEKSRYAMPNALVTFNRFWNSEGGVAGVNQPDTLEAYLRDVMDEPGLNCNPPN